MNEATSTASPSERIAVAFKTLIGSAKNINDASGELAKPIGSLERALKRLNLGVACWTRISGGSDGYNRWSQEVGYSRVRGNWRLAIRTLAGNEDDPEPAIEEWSFGDAPRYLRIKAVDKLPELIEALVKATDATTTRLKKKVVPAQELATAVNDLTNPKDSK